MAANFRELLQGYRPHGEGAFLIDAGARPDLDSYDVTALIFPDIAAWRAACPGLGADAPVTALLADDAVRVAIAQRLASLAEESPASFTHIARALLLADPPSIDANEMTDKGSINQRAVLQNRAALVDMLYPRPIPGEVITFGDA